MDGKITKLSKKRLKIMAAVCTGVIICLVFCLYQKQTVLFRVPWQDKSFSADTEIGRLYFILANKKLSISLEASDSENKTLLWESPEEYLVQDVLVTNVIPDEERILPAEESKEEVILLLWKKGRYGNRKPFWISKEETTWSQHLFVYTFRKEKLTSRWASSYLGNDIKEISAKDNWLFMKTFQNENQCFQWDSWGFTRMGEVNIAAVGDNLIHSQIYQYALKPGNSFDSIYEPVSKKIKEADLAVINQETPFVEEPAMYGSYPEFGTPAQVAEAVAKAGFDIAVLATNHALDRGMYGIDTTIAQFEKQDIVCVGTLGSEASSVVNTAYSEQQKMNPGVSPYRKVYKNGLTLGILNYTYGTNGKRMPNGFPNAVCILPDEQQVRKDIAAIKAQTDAVLVFIHWGTENSEEIDEQQKYWRDIFYDCGVTAVIGSHPHVLQKYEMYEKEGSTHKMLIYYSLGDFVSACQNTQCCRGGLADFCIRKTPEGCEIASYNLTKLEITYEKGRVLVIPADKK